VPVLLALPLLVLVMLGVAPALGLPDADDDWLGLSEEVTVVLTVWEAAARKFSTAEETERRITRKRYQFCCVRGALGVVVSLWA
jgi:hypothetical protein